MSKVVDIRCEPCEITIENVIVWKSGADVQAYCLQCGQIAIVDYFPRPVERTCWSPAETVVVHRDPATGKVRYPGRADSVPPAGYERVLIRSDREMAKFEREHNVVHEARHYDRNGRGFDDTFRGESY